MVILAFVMFILTVVGLFCIATYLYRKKKHTLEALIDDKRLVFLTVLGVVLIVVSSQSLKIMIEQPTMQELTRCILSSPCTLMYVLMAIITIVGFTITIHRLHEENVRITNYPRLLDQLSKMLIEAKNKNVPLGFLGNTPLLGSMTLRKDMPKTYGKFTKALDQLRDAKDKDQNTLLRPLVCLDWALEKSNKDVFNAHKSEENAKKLIEAGKDLGDFYMTFQSNNGFSLVDCAEGFLESEEFLEKADACKTRPIRTTKNNLPEYHIFVSEDSYAAIVVVPLDLPSEGAPRAKDHYQVSVVGQKLGGADNIGPILSTFERYCKEATDKQ